VVKLPPWFTVERAIQVARFKRVEHVLVEERGQVSGAVALEALVSAPLHELIGARVKRSTLSVPADAPLTAAAALMSSEGLDCLPVVRGGLLVGILTRAGASADVSMSTPGPAVPGPFQPPRAASASEVLQAERAA
jgi:CBS domain-containing protein